MDAGGRRRSVALAVVALAGCASPLSSVRWPEASRYPDAPSLVLDDDMTVRFEPGPDSGRAEALVTRRSLVAILRPGGEGAAHI